MSRYHGWDGRRTVESPWFYAVWFCLFGAVALFFAGDKYGERQAGIERRFQARSQTAVPTPANADSLADGRDASAAYSSPEDTVIPLWPLGAVLGALACVFAFMAYRAGVNGKGGMNGPASREPRPKTET